MRDWPRVNTVDEQRVPSRVRTWVATVAAVLTLATAVATAALWSMSWVGTGGPHKSSAAQPADTTLADAYGNLDLSFEANQGQIDEQVVFQAKGLGYSVYLTREADAVLVLQALPAISIDVTSSPAPPDETATVLRFGLEGANFQPHVAGVQPLAGVSNYFIGANRENWRTGVPHFRRVRYEQVYAGIDLAFYGNQRHLEYDFIVAPGADPKVIRMVFQGAESSAIAPSGDLILAIDGGEVVQRSPVVYQDDNGVRQAVEGSFSMLSQSAKESVVGFDLGKYDPTLPLVIDPTIDYSTYLGGGSGDIGLDIAVDSSGSAYLTGITFSNNFPTQSPIDPAISGASDVFVTKFDPEGAALVYSTYLGGSGGEAGNSIAVDASGNAYVTGETSSTNFPLVNPYQPSYGGGFQDGFVLKLNAAGSALTFSTYWGGSSPDFGEGVAVDILGNPYVTGWTQSTNFPTKNASQGMPGTNSTKDAFVTKFNDIGTFVYYSTYLGGSADEQAADIAVNSLYQVYIVGITDSTDFPTQSAAQKSRAGDFDAFITKMNTSGTRAFSTYYGGSAFDTGTAIALDSLGRPYFTGWTQSSNFPTLGALQGSFAGVADVYVAKFTSTGTPTYSTYLGGTGDDRVGGITVDKALRAYVAGWTDSTDFPIRNPIQGSPGGGVDGFVCAVDASGSGLFYSSYLGGSGTENANSVTVDDSYNTYITGFTYSADFPTRNAYQPAKNTQHDVFLTKIEFRTLDFFIAATPTGMAPTAAVTAPTSGHAPDR